MFEEEVALLDAVERRLALFALSMIEVSRAAYDITHSDIQEEAMRLGLLVRSPDGGPPIVPADVLGIVDGTRSATAIRERADD